MAESHDLSHDRSSFRSGAANAAARCGGVPGRSAFSGSAAPVLKDLPTKGRRKTSASPRGRLNGAFRRRQFHRPERTGIARRGHLPPCPRSATSNGSPWTCVSPPNRPSSGRYQLPSIPAAQPPKRPRHRPLTRGARRSRTQTTRNGDSRRLVLQSVLQRSQAVAVDATLEAVLVNLGPSCLAQRLCCLRALRQHFFRQLGDAGVAPRLVRSGSALQPPHSGQHLWQLSRGSDPGELLLTTMMHETPGCAASQPTARSTIENSPSVESATACS